MVEFLAGLFGFALMTAYWPNISGVATTPRWDVAVLLAVVLFVAPRVRMTAAHWLGALLMGWLLLSLTWSNGRDDGIDIAFRMGCAAVAFAVGSLIKDIRPLIQGAALGIGISSAVAIAQWLGWHGMEQKGGAFSGLFFDRNRLAAAAALVALLAFLTFRQCDDYRDSGALYRKTLARNPEAWIAHTNLGVLLVADGRTGEAIEHYRAALALKPDLADAEIDMGVALAGTGRTAGNARR